MKRFSSTLTIPLVVLLATLLIAIALVRLSGSRVDDARRIFDAQHTQMVDAQSRVQKSGQEKDLIIRYLPDYEKLRVLGFVGEEQRISWLDALRNANQKGGLFGINYDISPRKTYLQAATRGASQMNAMQSVMKVRFQVLHEEDLPKFFEHLSEQHAGVFVINRCSLRRTNNAPAVRFEPTLSAECELSWITTQPQASAAIRQ